MIKTVSIKVDLEKCTGCGTCVDTCPVEVFELVDVGGEEKASAVNESECIVCMACEVSCPESAIQVVEE